MTTPQSDTAQIRKTLDLAFDDSTLSAFCFDYFPNIYDRFSQGMRKDDKIHWLLDCCRRHSTGFEMLLENVRKEYASNATPGKRNNFENEQLKPLIDALSAYLKPSPDSMTSPPTPLFSDFSEDGELIVDAEALRPPREGFDLQSFSATLKEPSGAVRLQDQLYVKRAADATLKQEIVKSGTTITIHAPRQTGKTSLLARGIHHAQACGATVILLHFYEREQLNSLNAFLYGIATTICDELGLDEAKVEQAWRGSRTASQKLTYFLQNQVLREFEEPIVLAIDNADDLLSRTTFSQDFFGLLRSWHDRRAHYPKLWGKLNMVLVISTEPYLLIDDQNRSPFNVGLKLNLEDFTDLQVQWLNQQHGSPVRAKELPNLMALLGGQPYLTRQALYTLLTQNLSWTDICQRATADQGPFAPHLRELYSVVRHNTRLKKALIQVIRASHCSNEAIRFRLLRAGLIKENNGGYTCRCGLYKQYFEEKLS